MSRSNREMRRMQQRQGLAGPDGTPTAQTRSNGARSMALKAPADRARTRTSPGQFLKDVRGELRKVAWPTRAEVVNYSTVVLITLVVLVLIIFLFDLAFAKAVLFLFDS